MKEAVIPKKHEGKRLDLVLSLLFPMYSRSVARKLLDMGNVTLNGNVEYRPNYKVNEGDVLEVDAEKGMQRKRLEPYKKDIEIVYQDSDIVIVNKPSGLIVHPTNANMKNSLLNAMYYVLRNKIGDYGVNLVNRIDKATSGLVVLAISPEGAWHYSRLFSEGKVQKSYLAVVEGVWHNRSEFRHSSLLNYDHVAKKQTVDAHQGTHAETIFSFVGYDKESDSSLIEARPITGRTHQIRVQLQELGHPIVGDTKYKGRLADRLMLHAYQLKLAGIDGQEISVTATPPLEFDFQRPL